MEDGFADDLQHGLENEPDPVESQLQRPGNRRGRSIIKAKKSQIKPTGGRTLFAVGNYRVPICQIGPRSQKGGKPSVTRGA